MQTGSIPCKYNQGVVDPIHGMGWIMSLNYIT